MIPVDGVIVEGGASVDESALTGEPFPRFRKLGDDVLSGSVCLTAPIRVRAEKAGDKGFLYLPECGLGGGFQHRGNRARHRWFSLPLGRCPGASPQFGAGGCEFRAVGME